MTPVSSATFGQNALLSRDPRDGYWAEQVGRARPRWESRSCNAEGPAAIAELRARQRKRVAAIRKLNARYVGRPFPKRAAERWNRLSRELDETQELITELRARCEAHRGA
jgi:hypothetical protein